MVSFRRKFQLIEKEVFAWHISFYYWKCKLKYGNYSFLIFKCIPIKNFATPERMAVGGKRAIIDSESWLCERVFQENATLLVPFIRESYF